MKNSPIKAPCSIFPSFGVVSIPAAWRNGVEAAIFTVALFLAAMSYPLLSSAQGTTSFTYQGRLNNSAGTPANGLYDFTFTPFSSLTGGIVNIVVTNAALLVSNGLFTTTVDFAGIPNGTAAWLELGVRTNGNDAFTTLAPRQQFTPTPYAMFANTASNLAGVVSTTQLNGTIGNSQLANSTIAITAGAGLSGGGTVTLGGSASLANSGVLSVAGNADVTASTMNGVATLGLAHNSLTVSAGTGLSGGGTVALGGSTTLNNAGVLSVTGNADITASTIGGAVTLGDTATSANTASTIVKRDPSGNFSASTVTLSGNLNLPAPSATAGGVYSSGSRLIHGYGGFNFFAGGNAGNFTLTGAADTGVGVDALRNNTSGAFNTANGWQALMKNTAGNYNTAVGTAALLSNTNGNNNTALGYQALSYNTSGSENTAAGFNALFNNTNGNLNTAVGGRALQANTNGLNNTAVGHSALTSNTSGSNNTAVGAGALNNTRTGYNNIGIGYSGGSALTGSNNIAIGNSGGVGENDTIRIGAYQTNIFIAGIWGYTAVSGVPVYADSFGHLGTFTSSSRFKQDIQDMDDASDLLLALRPVKFHYKTEFDPKAIPQFGLVAEEVEKVDPDLVARDDKNQIYSVRYEAVNAMLLNEFLKQHRKVAAQDRTLHELGQKVEAQNAENGKLKQRLEKLELLLSAQK